MFRGAVDAGLAILIRRFDSVATPVVRKAEESYRWALKTALLFAGLSAIVSFAVLTSLATYALLYVAIIPKMAFHAPVYFDYACKGREDAGLCWPEARIDLHFATRQYGSSSSSSSLEDVPKPDKDLLVKSEQYDAFVYLDFVENDANARYGAFTIDVALGTAEGAELYASRRPIVVPYKSRWTQILFDMWLFVPRFLGFLPTGNVARRVVVFETLPTVVDVRRATLILSTSEITVETAELFFLVRLKGIRYFMYHWFGTSLVCFVAVATWNQLLIVGGYAAWYVSNELDEAQSPPKNSARNETFPNAHTQGPRESSDSDSSISDLDALPSSVRRLREERRSAREASAPPLSDEDDGGKDDHVSEEDENDEYDERPLLFSRYERESDKTVPFARAEDDVEDLGVGSGIDAASPVYPQTPHSTPQIIARYRASRGSSDRR